MRSLFKSSKLIPIVLLIALGGLNGCFRSPSSETTPTSIEIVEPIPTTTPAPQATLQPVEPFQLNLGLILVITGAGLLLIAFAFVQKHKFAWTQFFTKSVTTPLPPLQSTKIFPREPEKIKALERDVKSLQSVVTDLVYNLQKQLNSKTQVSAEAEKVKILERQVESLRMQLESQTQDFMSVQVVLNNLQQKIEDQPGTAQNLTQFKAWEREILSLRNIVNKLQEKLESQTQTSTTSPSINQDPTQNIIDRFQRNPKDLFESGERIKALKPDQEPHLLTLTPKQSSPVALIRVSGQGGYLIPKPGYNTYAKFEHYFTLEGFQTHGDLQLLELAQVSPLRDRWMLEKKGKICFNSL